jgi:hypothetical protein
VEHWVSTYGKQLGGFRDSDNKPPRHSFFYPIEAYHRECVSGVEEICRQGFGEIEVHLHHDNDTPENLHRVLLEGRQRLAEDHGQLAMDRETGALHYGFIHGNWALNNSHPQGRWCGVNDEVRILKTTGCYADFTMPAAPDRAQTRTINSIYYGTSCAEHPGGHDGGPRVGTAQQPADSLMMIQGPLVLNWRKRKFGLVPRVENACLQGNQPATVHRIPDWLKARVQVPSRPDWFFVKLHTHGANEGNMNALLGEPMREFHRGLSELAEKHANFRYHYVTARELYNLARAAEAGWTGEVDSARDHELLWNSDFSTRSDREAVPTTSSHPADAVRPAYSCR